MLLPVLILALQAPAVAVPPDTLAPAFEDADARALLLRARAAWVARDSALVAYDATAYQRIMIGGGVAAVGRDRAIFACESVGRVRWRLGRGAWIELRGMRSRGVVCDATPPVPHYPGMEAAWIGGDPLHGGTLGRFELIHPILAGAEAHYTFAAGDSVSVRLPDGTVVRLRELRVRPRVAASNLVVGSFWFDRATGQLVRAAYRPAATLDVWVLAARRDSVNAEHTPAWARMLGKALVSPLSLEISAISVEYGLYDGRFWLPRSRVLGGSARASLLRGTMQVEQRFDYASVNAPDTLPSFVADTTRIDTDSLEGREKLTAVAGLRGDTTGCSPSARYTVTSVHDGVPVAMMIPCNLSLLPRSPELRPSILDVREDAGAAADRAALIASALSLGAQAPFGRLTGPTLGYGLQWTRFNRVEGLSVGAQVDQPLGSGYSARAVGRFGFSDRVPNASLRIDRSNLTDSIHVGAYTRLVAANDWGEPLSLSSSLSAALFGRDEGFYYRAAGVEIGGGRDARFAQGAHMEWRLFVERQRPTRSRLSSTLAGAHFGPNIQASDVRSTGAALRLTRSYGLDPRGARLLTDARLEVAAGDSSYARAALELTASRGLGGFVGAITASGGTSAGALPPQRRWFLGGSRTIRGQSADTASSGNAYWFARTELSAPSSLALSWFYDIGWVGDRSRWREVGRPMSGAGVGLRLFDGLVRLDAARGIAPRRQWRFDLSINTRF